MKITDNKFLVTLVTTNIVAFITIFVLIWMLWDKNSIQKTIALVTNDKVITDSSVVSPTTDRNAQANVIQPEDAESGNQQHGYQQKSFIKQKVLSVFESVVQEVKAADIDVSHYMENDAEDANQRNEVLEKGVSDKAYIAAYETLDKQVKPAVQYSQEQASTVQIVASLETGSYLPENHFNKIDVSDYQSKKVLTQKLAAIVTNNESLPSNEVDAVTSTTPAWKDYLNSLKSAEAERENEMRTIKVKRGDTLWRIATRAYGNGSLYTKIFEANPHLINPESITTGEILRVPL